MVGLVALVGGLIALLFGGGARAVRGAALGAAAALLVVAAGAGGHGSPVINDVSTDLADPPPFVHAGDLAANRGRDLAYPEGFRDVVRAAYADLKPLALSDPPDKAFDRALLVARSRPDWRITEVDRDPLTFEGVATSWLFRFRDDFVVRVRPAAQGSIVDMRSKSRDGRGDLGVNAARIRAYFAELSGGAAR